MAAEHDPYPNGHRNGYGDLSKKNNQPSRHCILFLSMTNLVLTANMTIYECRTS